MEEFSEKTSCSSDIISVEAQNEEPGAISRDPWRAGCASLIIPGLGQMYNGQQRNWLILFIGWPLMIHLNILLILSFGIPYLILVSWGVFLWSAYDAFRYARTCVVTKYKPFQRRYYYVLYTSMILYMITVLISGSHDIFGVSMYRIPTGSMENTLLVGDYIAVDSRAYADHGPQNGDIVVYLNPQNPKVSYAKRIVATPGQWVHIQDGRLLINDSLIPEPYTLYKNPNRLAPGVRERGIYAQEQATWNHDNYGPLLVPDGKYFILGDNRDNSVDSRNIGFVPKENIIGKVKRVYWSVDKFLSWLQLKNKIRFSRIGLAVE